MSQEPITKEQLEELCNKYDTCSLECDGLTRVLATILIKNNIPFKAFIGVIVHSPTMYAFAPHYWLEVEEFTIDYRARMWFAGLAGVPHGVFTKSHFPVEYDGDEIFLDPLPDSLFEVLTQKLPAFTIHTNNRLNGHT